MITLYRTFKLWKIRVKWKLAFYQFIDKQLKELVNDPEKIEKKIMPYLAELIHSANQANDEK